MEGYSVLNSIILLFYGGLLLNYSFGRPSRAVERALSLLVLAGIGLWFLGYDPRTSSMLPFQVSAVIFVAALIFALVQYGRRELAEGDYDEPYEEP